MATVAKGGDEPRKPQGSIPLPKTKGGPKQFLIDVQREMKKVSWPTRAETTRLTGIVLSVCLMLVVILTGLSFVFEKIIDLVTKGRI